MNGFLSHGFNELEGLAKYSTLGKAGNVGRPKLYPSPTATETGTKTTKATAISTEA